MRYSASILFCCLSTTLCLSAAGQESTRDDSASNGSNQDQQLKNSDRFGPESDLLKRLRAASKFSAGVLELVKSVQLEGTQYPYFLSVRPDSQEVLVFATKDPADDAPADQLDEALRNAGRTADLWNLVSGETIREVDMNESAVGDFSPDGRWLTRPYYDSVELIDFDSGATRTIDVREPASDLFNFCRVVFSADSQFIISTRNHDELRVIDIESGEMLANYDFPLAQYSTLFSVPNTTLIGWVEYVGDVEPRTERIRVVDFMTGETINTIDRVPEPHIIIGTVVVSDDGRFLARLDVGNCGADLFDIQTGELIWRTTDTSGLWGSFVAPDVLALRGVDNRTIDFWNLHTGQKLTSMVVAEEEEKSIFSFAISPDAQAMVTVSNTGKLSFWRVREHEDYSWLWYWGIGVTVFLIIAFMVWRKLRRRPAAIA